MMMMMMMMVMMIIMRIGNYGRNGATPQYGRRWEQNPAVIGRRRRCNPLANRMEAYKRVGAGSRPPIPHWRSGGAQRCRADRIIAPILVSSILIQRMDEQFNPSCSFSESLSRFI